MAAYTGSSDGWVKERFLRARRLVAQITVGAEAANVIPVSIALTTVQEDNNEHVAADDEIDCLIELIESGDGELAEHTSEADFSPTTGTAVTGDDRARMIVTSNDSGVIALDVTDRAGASAKTFALKVTPLNVPGFVGSALITFD